MGVRNWLIVSEISKEHSNFIFKNLEAGNSKTWQMKGQDSPNGAEKTVHWRARRDLLDE
jgi:hypothetical protein